MPLPRFLLTPLAAALLLAVAAGGAQASLRDLPVHAPPAALAAAGRLPVAAGWPFPDAFPHTSGTGRLDRGAYEWSDYLYDDQGAGSYTYSSPSAAMDGADIFRIGIGLDATSSYWRIDWNTLADRTVPIAEFGLATGAPARGAPWPGGSGIATPVMAEYLLVSSRGAWLIDGATGHRTPITGDAGSLTVDAAAQSFVVRVSRDVLPVQGTWTVRAIAGLANSAGDGFAPAGGAGTGQPNVYNVGFRGYQQESPMQSGGAKACGSASSSCNDTAQAAALSKSDVTPFAATIDWGRLASRVTTREPQPTGFTDRWYVSSMDYGQGRNTGGTIGQVSPPQYLGRVQPYGIYVPAGYRPGTATPLAWYLHGSGGSEDTLASKDGGIAAQCDQRHAICATPLMRGAYGYCVDYAELDFWQVWRDIAAHYSLDPTRTTMSGDSMGGICTNDFSMSHPDMFGAVCDFSGALQNTNAGVNVNGDLPAPTPQTHAGASADPRVENLRWVRDFMSVGGADEFLNQEALALQAKALDDLGYRYRFELYPDASHTGELGEGAFSECNDFTDKSVSVAPADPGHVTYQWNPQIERPALGLRYTGDYWLDRMAERDPSQTLARVDATSAAQPDPEETAQRTTTTAMPDPPHPVVVKALDWTPGATPAPQPQAALSLTNVGRLALDLPGAGFGRFAGQPGATVAVDDDGQSAITLEGALPNSPVTVDGNPVAVADESGLATVVVPYGHSTIGFTPGGFSENAIRALRD